MIDHLSSLAALGPGLGHQTDQPIDIQEFARRRVDHLREKVNAGDLAPDMLKQRLNARYGSMANDIVGKDGSIDFDRLQRLIITQQVAKLQDRLEDWFGEEAKGIVGPEGAIDQQKFEALHNAEKIDRPETGFDRSVGDHGDSVIGSDGSININALRELFAFQEFERPYEPAGLVRTS